MDFTNFLHPLAFADRYHQKKYMVLKKLNSPIKSTNCFLIIYIEIASKNIYRVVKKFLGSRCICDLYFYFQNNNKY